MHFFCLNFINATVIEYKLTLSKQMNEADNALYLAKDNGRNQIVIFGSDEQ
jgi:PleD family two-component response regulator